MIIKGRERLIIAGVLHLVEHHFHSRGSRAAGQALLSRHRHRRRGRRCRFLPSPANQNSRTFCRCWTAPITNLAISAACFQSSGICVIGWLLFYAFFPTTTLALIIWLRITGCLLRTCTYHSYDGMFQSPHTKSSVVCMFATWVWLSAMPLLLQLLVNVLCFVLNPIFVFFAVVLCMKIEAVYCNVRKQTIELLLFCAVESVGYHKWWPCGYSWLWHVCLTVILKYLVICTESVVVFFNNQVFCCVDIW